MNETELIVRLQQKEEAAFRQLVEGWKDRIYNTALGLIQQAEDAEDITQDVFVTALGSIGEFRAESGISTWLYRITVNKSIDHLRKKKRKKLFGLVLLIRGKNGGQENDNPDFIHPGVQLEKKQEAAILFSAIRKLPEQQRIAYSLHKVEGLPMAEIGKILNLSEGAVESLLQRAKQNLRKSLLSYYQNNRHER
ncbi:RNA polymerase sigma factor [Flavihumibacter profundi]|uniref:RNA polymerase sigma factor n=1 Tax=Flavihumibacter profundi TaxID=2716883 RepID=UPI001CC3CD34|nr:RNA polymerase sigma factor [Flavihumibacter profundi]MBZ5858252.1 RNA polymerase sigma factor [Flavihumibacter profundi]